LSSRTPIRSEKNAAISVAIITFVIGKKNTQATKTPINSGIPPPLGIGILCNMAGCLCFFGSSTILNFLRKIRQSGVAITVTIKAIIKGIMVILKFNIK
jgi:hypothetical protein